ncbi:DUF2239 family protein [bacterium]|nr:MAG: DUF2239 family protein [bacterium]
MNMNESTIEQFTAFAGQTRIASGDLATVAQGAKESLETAPQNSLLIFDNTNSKQVEIDLRGSVEEVLSRLPQPEKAAPTEPAEAPKAGRPKLGVTAREVTLLPRHWDWLGSQPGGASVTLRKLVEEARRNSQAADQSRQAQEAIDRFMMVMAGNFPGFEEASRALYRNDKGLFEKIIAEWPQYIAAHLRMLSEGIEWKKDENK